MTAIKDSDKPIIDSRLGYSPIQTPKSYFWEAIQWVCTPDKRITKREWDNTQYYGVLRDGRLQLHKPDGKFYDWIISDGDLFGDDWVVL